MIQRLVACDYALRRKAFIYCIMRTRKAQTLFSLKPRVIELNALNKIRQTLYRLRAQRPLKRCQLETCFDVIIKRTACQHPIVIRPPVETLSESTFNPQHYGPGRAPRWSLTYVFGAPSTRESIKTQVPARRGPNAHILSARSAHSPPTFAQTL